MLIWPSIEKFEHLILNFYYNKLTQPEILGVLENEIATLVNEEKPAGSYEVNFNSAQLSSGVYFYKIQTGSFVETKKMILLRWKIIPRPSPLGRVG